MKLIAFDIETWGSKPGYTLQPWRVKANEGGILTFAAFDGEKVEINLANFFGVTCCADKEQIILCGWNLKFDLSFLISHRWKDQLKDIRYLDGMLLLKRMMSDLTKYNLKDTLIRFKDKVESEQDYNEDIVFKSGYPDDVYSRDELQLMQEYNNKDVIYTWRLIRYLISQAPKKMIQQAIRECTVSLLFANAWQRGILLDRDALNTYQAKLATKLFNLEKLLAKVGLTPKIVASPMQLRDYLIKTLRIQLIVRTEKGAFSVNKGVLNNLYFKTSGNTRQIIRLINTHKKIKTEIDKFVASALDCLKESDWIHPEPILSGTNTGRLTYSMYTNATETKEYKNGNVKQIRKRLKVGVPIHQIKKSGGIRKLFIAPKDHSLVELDFCNQEMRLIACIANESRMIKLFNEEKDLHAFTGAGIIDLSYDDFQILKETDNKKYSDMRKLGKLTNLALQYKLSARGLYKQWHDTYGLTDKTEQDALEARQTYMRLYSGIPEYWQLNPEKARKQGYIDSMGHRRCTLLKWTAEDEYRSTQTAINFPVQATGADQKILALYYLRKFLFANDIKLAWDLHDGLFFYVPKHQMQTETVAEMVDILNNLPYEKAWGWSPQVTFPVEAKIGENWGELKELKMEGV